MTSVLVFVAVVVSGLDDKKWVEKKLDAHKDYKMAVEPDFEYTKIVVDGYCLHY